MSRARAALTCAGLVASVIATGGCGSRRFKEPTALLPAYHDTKTYLAPRPAREESFRASPPPLLEARPRPTPRPIETRLSNGVRAIFIERFDFPAVTALLVLDRGSTSARPGVAATYAHAMLEGSDVADDVQCGSQLQFLGARVHSSLSRERVTMSVNALSPLFSSALENAAGLFVKPTLGDDAIERASISVASRRNLDREDPSALSSDALMRTMFPLPHPWAVPLWGEHLHRKRPGLDEDARVYVDDSTLAADVRAFRDARVTADRVGVVCIGDMGPVAMERIVERALAKLPTKPSPPEPVTTLAPPLASRRIILIDRPGMKQASIALGWTSPRASEPDSLVVDVLARAAGTGLGSLLNLSARRDMGATYGVHAEAVAGRDAGYIEISAAVDAARTADVLSSIDAALERLRTTPLDDASLGVAKVKSHVALEASTAEGLAKLYAEALAEGRSAADVATHDARVDALTAEQVRDAAARYLPRDAMHVVVVGDVSRLEAPLRALAMGEVTVKR